MPEFLLDTNTASLIMIGHRPTITAMRRAKPRAVSLSTVSQSEMLFGAHTHASHELATRVRRFLERMMIVDWDQKAAEAHARIRAQTRVRGRSAGPFDLMIAAHAIALGMVLVTSDTAIGNLGIAELKIVEW